MSLEWIDTLLKLTEQNTPAVMISVIRSEGSVPRETGTRLIVTAEKLFNTIGGGNLEYQAVLTAREWLKKDIKTASIIRYSLNASLGQCCGGVVTLSYERITPQDRPWLLNLAENIQRYGCVRRTVELTPLDETPPTAFLSKINIEPVSPAQTSPSCFVFQRSNRTLLMEEVINTPQFHIVLFGAGHVGRALVNILSPLPCTIIWADERQNEFPAQLPVNVSKFIDEEPGLAIDEAPTSSYFLVMTHSHALDQELAEQILKRNDFIYFGMIGSKTKRKKFEHRLLKRNITQAQLNRMNCPIGINGIQGKEPAVIAISVAAELLRVRGKYEATLHHAHDEYSIVI